MSDNTESAPITTADALLAAMNAEDASSEPENQSPELNNNETPDDSDQGDSDEDGLGDSPATEDNAEDEDVSDEDTEDDESRPDDSLEPPALWEPEDKAKFAELGRKAQQLILQRADKDRAYIDSKVNEAASVRTAAEKKNQIFDQYIPAMEASIAVQQQALLARYDGIDWPRYFEQDVSAASADHARFEQDKAAIQRSYQDYSAVKAVQEQQTVQHEMQILESLIAKDPSLAKLRDPAVLIKFDKYAKEQGFTSAEIDRAGARFVVAGYKAMRLDEANANAKAKKLASKSSGQQNNKSVPTKMISNGGQGGQPNYSSAPASVTSAHKNFAKSKSVDSLLALMNAETAAEARKG